jgi:hypothetical protein
MALFPISHSYPRRATQASQKLGLNCKVPSVLHFGHRSVPTGLPSPKSPASLISMFDEQTGNDSPSSPAAVDMELAGIVGTGCPRAHPDVALSLINLAALLDCAGLCACRIQSTDSRRLNNAGKPQVALAVSGDAPSAKALGTTPVFSR